MPADGTVELRGAVASDSAFVWETNNHPSARAHSLRSAAIPWEDHERWFADKIESPAYRIFVAEVGAEPIGVARYEVLAGRQEALVSLALAADHQGRGWGAKLLCALGDAALAHPGVRCLVATILPANVASVRVFERVGYVRVSGPADDELRYEFTRPE